jgi:hypothetical protein
MVSSDEILSGPSSRKGWLSLKNLAVMGLTLIGLFAVVGYSFELKSQVSISLIDLT